MTLSARLKYGFAALALIAALGRHPSLQPPKPPGPRPRRRSAANTSTTPWASTWPSPASSGSSGTRSAARSNRPIRSSSRPIPRPTRGTSGTAARSPLPVPRRSPSPGRRSRAASPISGRSGPGTGTAARAPGARWPASTPGSSPRATGQGIWIGQKNQLRKEFTLKGRVKRARAYIAGLGYYELRLNGRKAGNHVLDPAWTTYDKRVLYVDLRRDRLSSATAPTPSP